MKKLIALLIISCFLSAGCASTSLSPGCLNVTGQLYQALSVWKAIQDQKKSMAKKGDWHRTPTKIKMVETKSTRPERN